MSKRSTKKHLVESKKGKDVLSDIAPKKRMKKTIDEGNNTLSLHTSTSTSSLSRQPKEDSYYACKKGGKPGNAGFAYQKSLLMLILMEAHRKGYKMCMGTEVDAAGKMDDVVFKHFDMEKWFGKYIQVKRKGNDQILERQLTAIDGDFSLCSYVSTVFDLIQDSRKHEKGDATRQPGNPKESVKLENFVIITNTNFGGKFKWENWFECEKWEENGDKRNIDDILLNNKSMNSKAKKYKLKNDGKLFDIISDAKIKNFDDKIKLMNAQTINGTTYLQEFMNKFRLIVNYPDTDDIEQYIRNVLKNNFHLNEVSFAYAYFAKCVSDWYRNYANGPKEEKKAEFITCEFFEKVINDIKAGNCVITLSDMSDYYLEKISNYKIDFKQNLSDLNDFLSPNGKFEDKQILFLLAECNRWSSLYVVKTLKSIKKDEGMIFVILDDLHSIDRIIEQFNHFLSHSQYDLPAPLIIECQSKDTVEIQGLYKKLNEKIDHKKKKIILIAEVVEKSTINETTTHLYKDSTSFKDLTEDSQNAALENVVYIQDKPISLNQIIDRVAAAEVFNVEKIDTLLKIIEGKLIKIGDMDAFSSIGFNKHFYIERIFGFNGGDINENDISNPEQFDQKVIFLANDSGFGKSTVLTSIALKMKDKCPGLWIIRINLSTHVTNLDKIELRKQRVGLEATKCVDINFAIAFSSKLAVTSNSLDLKFQRHIFETGLRHGSPKIVIMFDGFNEICPFYSPQTTELIRALAQTKITQIWVASQTHEQLNISSSKIILKPWTEVDQKTFLNDFWKFSLLFKKGEDDQNYNDRDISEIHNRLNNMASNLNSQYFEELSKHISEIQEKDDLETLKHAINESNLCAYIDKMLKIWNTWNVPLNLRLFAEIIFEKNFQPIHANDIDLVSLYDEFVEMKLRIYCKRYDMLNNPVTLEIFKTQLGNWRNILHETAKEIILKQFEMKSKLEKLYIGVGIRYEKGFVAKNKFKDEDKVSLARTGLVTLTNEGHIEFIHPSFGDYFMSEYLICNIKTEQRILFDKILLNCSNEWRPIRKLFDNYIEKYFFKIQSVDKDKSDNDFLKNIFLNLKEEIFHSLHEIKFQLDINKRTVPIALINYMLLNQPVSENHLYIFKFIVEKFKAYEKFFNKLVLITDQIGQTILFNAFYQDKFHEKNIVREEKCFTSSNTNDKTRDIILPLLQNISDDETFEDLIILTLYGNRSIHEEIFENLLDATKNHSEINRKLIDFNKKFDFKKIREQLQFLNKAIDEQDEIEVENLLIRSKCVKALVLASFNALNTCLHRAIKKQNCNIVKSILKIAKNHPRILGEIMQKVYCDGENDQTDFLNNLIGVTAITSVAEMKHCKLFDILLEYVENDLLVSMVVKRGRYWNTVLHCAFYKFTESCDSHTLQNHADFVCNLLKKLKNRLGNRVLEKMVEKTNHCGLPPIFAVNFAIPINGKTVLNERLLMSIKNNLEEDLFEKLVSAKSVFGGNIFHPYFEDKLDFKKNNELVTINWLKKNLKEETFAELVSESSIIQWKSKPFMYLHYEVLDTMKLMQTYPAIQYIRTIEKIIVYHFGSNDFKDLVESNPLPVFNWIENNCDNCFIRYLLAIIDKHDLKWSELAAERARRIKQNIIEIGSSVVKEQVHEFF